MTSTSSSTLQRVSAGARAAVAEHGWRQATLERIAQASGLSRMTLHRHGLGRDEIFALLAEGYGADFRAALEPAVLAEGSGLERLGLALGAVCEVSERHLGFLAGLDDEADTKLFHERAGEVRSRDAYIGPLEQLLREGIADGSIRDVDVTETATLAVNTVDRTYRHLRVAHDWPPPRAAEVVDLVCRGLASSAR